MIPHTHISLPRSSGFTLVEMAMVLLIVALLLSGLVPSISQQMEQRRITETRQQLEEIKDALMGFAIINGRLPCPASATSNGQESPVGGGNCTNTYNGFVPAATLGMASALNSQGHPIDAWGNPLAYAVTESNSNAYTTSNGLATVGLDSLSPDLLVCSTSTGISGSNCATGKKLTAGSGIPVILYSSGGNAAYGGTGADESKNNDNNRVFVSHTPTPETAANGEFDDIVTWMSNHLLLNRMVTAGKLP